MVDNPWREIAVGAQPGVSVVGSRRADPTARWTAAVALGGQGRYAAAAALLEELVRDPRTPRAVRAHALVTRASHLRQQGGRALAARLDGQAVALVAGPPEGLRDRGARAGAARDRDRSAPPVRDTLVATSTGWRAATGDLVRAGGAGAGRPVADGEVVAELCADLGSARADALVGLAADAVGRGGLTVAERLLTRADADAVGWRPRVRWNWVRAEVALARGELGTAAAAADAAVAGSAEAGALRHLLKSRLLAAVTARLRAADTAGLADALAVLDGLADETGAAGLIPLRWAALLAAADAAEDLGRRVRGGARPARASGSGRGPADAPAPETPTGRRAAIPSVAESHGCTSGAKPHPPVVVGPTADTRPSGGPERPSIRPIGSETSHDRRGEEMRESTSGAPNDAARRRHAAAVALSVICRRSDTHGRRLMGESAPKPERLAVT